MMWLTELNSLFRNYVQRKQKQNMLDYLNGKQGIVTFSKYTNVGPVVFEYQKSPRVLIMPMQVQWGDEKTVDESPETTGSSAEATDEISEPESIDESITGEETEASTEEATTESETVAGPTATD